MPIDSHNRGDKYQSRAEVRYSVIITCHNQQDFIEDAIQSVLLQKCASMEVIVVDDGSQDRSLEIIRRYETSLKLLPLRTNCGGNEARNRGVAIARGEYLIFLDGDDLFTPWALEVYERLISERQPSTIVSGVRRFEGPIPQLCEADVPKRLEFVEYESLMAKDRTAGMYIGAFVINRRAFQDVGGWTPGFWYLDGQDMYAKLAYSGTAILILSPYTMLYRMHAGNTIKDVPPYIGAARLMIDRERGGYYPGGREKRFERYGRLGGVILFCMKKLFLAGLYSGALRLVVCGWPMILAAIILKPMARLKGRRPVQTCEFSPQSPVSPNLIAQIHEKRTWKMVARGTENKAIPSSHRFSGESNARS